VSLRLKTLNRLCAGPELTRAIATAYRADVPFKLEGGHGIGKTESVAAAADQLGIGLISLNLAVMEPTDLVGLPRSDGERLRYHRPEWLERVATDERGGFLFLDEINRVPRYIVAPLHAILTGREIDGVRFQKNWLPCAAANVGPDFDVAGLDPALESRFLTIHVEASVVQWSLWAKTDGIDDRVVSFVEATPGIFDSSSPREWATVGRLLEESDDLPVDLLEVLAAGVVGDSLASAFVAYVGGGLEPLRPADVVAGELAVIERLRYWVTHGNVALIAGSAKRVQVHVQPSVVHDVLTDDERRNIVRFAFYLPDDLRDQWNAWAIRCGYQELVVRARRAG